MRILVPAAALLAAFSLANAEETVDGKVKGLNPEAFAVLKANISPGTTIQERNAHVIATAIKRPRSGESEATIDEKEKDLLTELTQSAFRRIVVTREGSDSEQVVTYPTSNKAKLVFVDVLDGRPDLDAAWLEGASGFGKIVTYYKRSARGRTTVLAFVKQKMKAQMAVSDMKNAYKPLRDEIAPRYGYTGMTGADASTGRTILYKTMYDLDVESDDKLPDFLYTWIKPLNYVDPAPRPAGMQRAEDYNKN